jgi:hypothetical protein
MYLNAIAHGAGGGIVSSANTGFQVPKGTEVTAARGGIATSEIPVVEDHNGTSGDLEVSSSSAWRKCLAWRSQLVCPHRNLHLVAPHTRAISGVHHELLSEARASQGHAWPSWPGVLRHPCEEPGMATTRERID